jgi:hypothetical protein
VDAYASRTFPRTTDGLRVAVAGLPGDMPIVCGEGVELTAQTVADLRALSQLPHRVEVVIGYSQGIEIAVSVNRSEIVSENF